MPFFETFTCYGLALLLALIMPSFMVAKAAMPGPASRTYIALAQEKFAQKDYDEAIVLYRKHLRQYRNDYTAWDELAAAYYHTGLPKRALRYLKSVERKTSDRSYNFYYQGLCYSALGDGSRASQYFQYAAQYSDEYASRAVFELAVLNYNAKDSEKAKYWLAYYTQRWPAGVYRADALRMQSSLATGTFLTDVTGMEPPDQDKALYRYNKLSLMSFPHYWLVQLGGGGYNTAGNEPDENNKLKASADQNVSLIANAAIGLGPFRAGPSTIWGGYTYRQLWLTDMDRIDTYFMDPTDFRYQPFQTDLLQRQHELYGDFRREIASNIYTGLYGRLDFTRIGSSLLISPDNNDMGRVQKVSETSLLIPWIGASYYKDFRTLLYLYLRKEISEETPEYSNKTYSLDASGGSQIPLSVGISHNMTFKEYNLDVDVELFRYEFIYNDYWLDYNRSGFIVGAEHEFLPGFTVSGLFGLYSDAYILPHFKQFPCSEVTQIGNGSEGNDHTDDTANKCYRNDSGMLYQVGISWNYTQFHRISAQLTYVSNANATMLEFNQTKLSGQIVATMAFPSVKRVERFIDRFADSAFTKEEP